MSTVLWQVDAGLQGGTVFSISPTPRTTSPPLGSGLARSQIKSPGGEKEENKCPLFTILLGELFHTAVQPRSVVEGINVTQCSCVKSLLQAPCAAQQRV